MRRLSVRQIIRFLIFASALFYWVYALILSGDLVKSASSVSLRYGTDGIPSSTVDRMLEEESVPFAAWVQNNNQLATDQDFSRETTVQVVEIAGDAELVLPVEELLHGFLPVRESMDTCAVDTATAYALWGGTDVTGEILIYGDREYTVTGVFSLPENTMLMQSRIEKDISFPHLEIRVSGPGTPRQQADEFRNRYSLPKPDMLKNHVETAAMLRQLTLLPALFVATMLLWRVLRRCFGKPFSSLGRAGFAAAMVAGILLSAWAIGFSAIIPAAAIPGRWSDFSFWSTLMEDMVEQARLSRAYAWPTPDLVRLQGRYSLFLYSGKALAGFVISILWKSGMKRREERQDGIHNTKKYS